MANYYFTIPNSVTLPTDGNKVSLTTACELHRDDSALPNALTVAAGAYNVFLADTPGTGTATAADVTAPTLLSTVPADNATDIAIGTTIDLVFSETVVLGTGNIVLRDNDGGFADLETFNAATGTGDNGGTLTLVTTNVTNDTVRITPGANLANSIEHAVQVASTAVVDTATSPNAFAGIADDTTVSFTTAAAASGPTLVGYAQMGGATPISTWGPTATAILNAGASVGDVGIIFLVGDYQYPAGGVSAPTGWVSAGSLIGNDSDTNTQGMWSELWVKQSLEAGDIASGVVFDFGGNNEAVQAISAVFSGAAADVANAGGAATNSVITNGGQDAEIIPVATGSFVLHASALSGKAQAPAETPDYVSNSAAQSYSNSLVFFLDTDVTAPNSDALHLTWAYGYNTLHTIEIEAA